MAGRGIERLSTTTVAAWIRKPNEKQASTKLADGGALYLVRLPSGVCTWRIKYRIAGVEKTYSVGPATTTSLSDARAVRREVRDLLARGVDPVKHRLLARAEQTAASSNLFSAAADAWLEKKRPEWTESHFKKAKQALDRDVMPWIGALPVAGITPAMLTVLVERMESRGVRETAAKILRHVREIFRLAQVKGLRNDNPADAVGVVLTKQARVVHRPALLKFEELGDVLRRANAAPISQAVRLCHRLIAYTAVRISNAVSARWDEFDLDAKPALWTIPRARMKVTGRDHDHVVILPEPIATELRVWRKQAEPSEFVFPGRGRAHLSREALEKVLRVTLGLADVHCAHGWRASLSTLSKDDARFPDRVVEMALDHVVDSAVARAYNRGQHLVERIRLAQWWGEQLHAAEQHVGKVLPIKRSVAKARAA